jgi:Fe2+ transport system protein FeoA
MLKSERGTQEWTLAVAPLGQPVDIVEIRADHPERLLVYGIRPGARITVESDAPLGGPRIVRAGRTRLAIDRRLARDVRVTPGTLAMSAASPLGVPGDEQVPPIIPVREP